MDPAPSAHLRPPKRKRGNSTLSYQEKMISLENKKLEWLSKGRKRRRSEFLHVLVSVNETTASHKKKVILEVTVPKHVGR